MAVPHPIAALLRRARNSKSPKESHDTAYYAWEASLRLAVAAQPVADVSALASSSINPWITALHASVREDVQSNAPALLAVHHLLGGERVGERSTAGPVTAKQLFSNISAYRDNTVGYASTRTAEFYAVAAPILCEGLAAAWDANLFFPADSQMVFVENVETDSSGERLGRILLLTGDAPMIENPYGTKNIPDDLPSKRLYLRTKDSYSSLYPWLLFQNSGQNERVLFFNGTDGDAEYLEYVSGDFFRGAALATAFPGVMDDLRNRLQIAPKNKPVDSQASPESTGAEQHAASTDESAGLFGALAGMIGSRPEHTSQKRFGDYELLGKLGEGGMGVVYLARQRSLDRMVALKMPPVSVVNNETALARFKREIEALSRCEHPNVVKIFSSGEESGVPYYAMEYVEGADLAKIARALSTHDDFDAAVTTASDQVKKDRAELFDGLPTLLRRFVENNSLKGGPAVPRREEKSRVRRLAELSRDAARGLHHLHERNVIHRDISPGNLMVTAGDHRVVIMDLGLATLTDASQSLTKDKATILGKLRYMSPEQLQAGRIHLDRRADVYSLGASLYELLTDHPFFDGDSNERLMKQVMFEKPLPLERAKPGLPKDLALIVSMATEKDADRRYASAYDFADDLDNWLTGKAISARPPTVGYLIKLAVNRNKAMFAGAAAALVACVAMIVFFTVREREVLKQRVQTETKLKKIAEEALLEQRRLSFEAIVRNAEADDALGDSAKVIASLEPYLLERELSQHPIRVKAEKLVERAQDGYKRLSAFAEQIQKGEQTVSLELGKGVRMEMVLIPAGTFMMGSSENEKDRKEDENLHEVTITRPFYMGKFHVTQEQYEAVAGTNPSYVRRMPKNPVEQVTWFDAVAFCEKLEKQSGIAQVRFTLPTEAQWEYACRAGTQTRYYFGDDENELEHFGWYRKNAGVGTVGFRTHPVGEKNKPNKFGLHDMHGNVYDWCQDWYDTKYYSVSPKEDPAGPETGEILKRINCAARVVRGGAWYELPVRCRSADRVNGSPDDRGYGVGFRVVVTLASIPKIAFSPPAIIEKDMPTETALDLGGGAKLDMVLVKPGEFQMGADDADAFETEKPVHVVKITQFYYIGKYPITVGQFKRFVAATDTKTEAEIEGKGLTLVSKEWTETYGASWKAPGFVQDDNHPVVMVSWNDAQAFIKWASKQTGATVSLPSEAQWEYAARGPRNLKYPWGNKWDGTKANHADQTLKNSGMFADTWQYSNDTDGYVFTSPVGQFKNASWCGASDMSGNVYQWCQDRFAFYTSSKMHDPANNAQSINPIARGGSWITHSRNCRSSSRCVPDRRYADDGFRVVVMLPLKKP